MTALAAVRSVLDQSIVAKVRAGRLRDDGWPYGLRAVVAVGTTLFVLTGLLALLSGAIRGGSVLVVPNSLTSSVPTGVVWVLVFLVTFCLAMFTTAAIHGPWWMTTLGLLAVVLLLGIWSAATTLSAGFTLTVLLALLAVLVIVGLTVVRRRRGLVWWEFPLVLGLIGAVVAMSVFDLTRSDRLYGFRFVPVFLEQTSSFLAFLVMPAAFAAGAAVAEITVGVTLVATRVCQQQEGRRWPYVVLAAVVAGRLAQEGRRLAGFDPVDDGWLSVLPAVLLVAAFTGLAWLVSRRARLAEVAVAELPDHLGRIGVAVGAAVVALMLPVIVLLFGTQIAFSMVPGDFGGFDPSPLVDRVVDAFRVVLGVVLVAVALRHARRGRPGLALVLGSTGIVLTTLGVRLLTGYRWALWIDVDAMVSVVTVLVLVVLGRHLVGRSLSPDRALGLVAVLVLATLLSVRTVVADPFAALLGYTGVAFVLFGLVWDLLTSSDWANTDGRRIRQPVRVLLAVAYPLLTVTILASDALIRRPRSFSDLNAYAELGDLVLGTGLLAAATVVVLSLVRADRPVA